METVSLGLKKRKKRQRNDAISLNKNKLKFTKRCCIDSTYWFLLQPLRQLDLLFLFSFPALFLGSRTCSVMQYRQQRSFVFYFYALHFFSSITRILLRESFFLSFIQKVYFSTTLSMTKWAKTHRNHHHHNHTEYSEETTATTPVLLFQLLFYHQFANFKLLFQNVRPCVFSGEIQLLEYGSRVSQAISASLIFSIKENLSNPQDSLIKYEAKAFFLPQLGVVGLVVVSTMFQRS